MTKITIEKDNKTPIGVGTWLLVEKTMGGNHLCVITQIKENIIKLIGIDNNNANRFNDIEINLTDYDCTYENLSEELINKLTENKNYKIVDAEIIIKL